MYDKGHLRHEIAPFLLQWRCAIKAMRTMRRAYDRKTFKETLLLARLHRTLPPMA